MEQGTPEWLRLRAKRMTASNAVTIQANGAGLKTYIYTTMAEGFSSAEPENYTNADMERGNELEPQARSLYELETGIVVEEVGFVTIGDYIGASPDGIAGDGLIEIKAHNDYKHLKLICEGVKGIEPKYIWQMQMQMYVTGRPWCDYVAINPNFEQTLIIHKIEADEKMFDKLEAGFETGIKFIKQIENKLK